MAREEWYFDASGGCEKCGNKEGWSADVPGRPHPHCDCVISKRMCGDLWMDIEWVGNTGYGGGPNSTCVGIQVTVYCDEDIIGGESLEHCWEAGSAEEPQDFDALFDSIAEAAAEAASYYDCPACHIA